MHTPKGDDQRVQCRGAAAAIGVDTMPEQMALDDVRVRLAAPMLGMVSPEGTMLVELVRLTNGADRVVKVETMRMVSTLASVAHHHGHRKATATVVLRALPGAYGMVQVPVYVTWAKAEPDARVRGHSAHG